jgi:hypothetical protein
MPVQRTNDKGASNGRGGDQEHGIAARNWRQSIDLGQVGADPDPALGDDNGITDGNEWQQRPECPDAKKVTELVPSGATGDWFDHARRIFD